MQHLNLGEQTHLEQNVLKTQIDRRRGLGFRIRASLVAALSLMGAVGLNEVSPTDAAADTVQDLGTSPDYPYLNAMAYNTADYDWWVDENGNGKPDVTAMVSDNDELVSPYGYYYRNCTDGAAYWVKKYDSVDVSGLGNAKDWDDNAARRGYLVKSGGAQNIEVGDIAQSDDGLYGHVGFVVQVVKNEQGVVTKVKLAEMNKAGTGGYSFAEYTGKNGAGNFIRYGSYDWDHFIDVNGVGSAAGGASQSAQLNESKPFALKRGDGMELFYRDVNDKLESAGWSATHSWVGPFVRSGSEEASNPVALSRGVDSMDVFYRDYAGNIRNIGWTAASGWGVVVSRVTDGSVSGDISAITRGPDSMDVFYRNGVGNLVNIGWSAITGWSKPQTLVADGSVAGSPVAIARGNKAMDVFYRDKNNRLEDVGWDATTGWKPPYARANNMQGNPAAIARTTGSMDIYFRDTNNGLGNAWWDVNSGWHYQGLENSGVNSDPAVLTRTGADQSVFYVDTSGSLREKSWSSTSGWAGSVTHANNVTGSPSAIARTDGNMDVFVRGNNGQMLNVWWDWRVGWNVGTPVPNNVRP